MSCIIWINTCFQLFKFKYFAKVFSIYWVFCVFLSICCNVIILGKFFPTYIICWLFWCKFSLDVLLIQSVKFDVIDRWVVSQGTFACMVDFRLFIVCVNILGEFVYDHVSDFLYSKCLCWLHEMSFVFKLHVDSWLIEF